MKKKQIRVRCWIDIDGVKFFGPGRAELLEWIEETGSISKAAKAMEMSYKKAWKMIDEMNESGRRKYVIPHKGGQQGGGAEITTHGKNLLTAYKKMMAKMEGLAGKESDILKLL